MLSEGEAHLKMYPNNFGIIWYIDMLLLHISFRVHSDGKKLQ